MTTTTRQQMATPTEKPVPPEEASRPAPAWSATDATPDLMAVFNDSIGATPLHEPMSEADVARLMAWATDPDGMDWALIERYEDWDEPKGS